MLIVQKKTFSLGVAFAVSFVIVLVLIFSPVFGGKNGLQFSDDMFNKLAKGSSYFIPDVTKKAREFNGTAFNLDVKLAKANMTDKALAVLSKAGAQASAAGEGRLNISGDLGALLLKAAEASDAMYKNDGKTVADLYGMDEKEAMAAWWEVLAGMGKTYQKEKKSKELDVVNLVTKKAVEPGYNFYGIEAQKVKDKAVIMTALLVFYVAYTMWWGYAVFFMFDGIGLSMTKSKEKKEV
jgi:hypothetical protein